MDIYEEPGTEGIVNIAKARDNLGASTQITHEGTRRAIVAEITAATLLDIARSLRVVAAEAALSMPSLADMLDEAIGDAGGVGDGAEDAFFVESDRVIMEGGDVPGTIEKLGITEGAVYAEVLFDAREGVPATTIRVWVENLRRVIETPDLGADFDPRRPNHFVEDGLGDPATCTEDHNHPAPDDGEEREPFASENAAVRERFERGEIDEHGTPIVGVDPGPEDLVDDDIDSDFEGDEHPAAANALEVLKANERERKVAKKGKKK